MTRTSAIFGVVSVLTAAIVGGVFIRKKIIDDILYYKALAEAETRWKREVRELEGDIGVLESNITAENKSKKITEKTIERYKKEIEELVGEITKHDEQMKLSEHYSITKEIADKISKNLDRQTSLKKIIETFTSKINELDSYISNEENNSNNNVVIKLENFKDNLKTQKGKLQKHAIRRIKLHYKFQWHKSKKKEKEVLKEKLSEKLKNNEFLFSSLESLIKELIVKLEEKNSKLLILKTKNPRKVS